MQRNNNPLKRHNANVENLAESGLSKEQALSKFRKEKTTPSGLENSSFFPVLWQMNKCNLPANFSEMLFRFRKQRRNLFSCTSNTKYKCTSRVAQQQTFFICLQISRIFKIHLFAETDRIYRKKTREHIFVIPSIVFTL